MGELVSFPPQKICFNCFFETSGPNGMWCSNFKEEIIDPLDGVDCEAFRRFD